MLPVLVILYFLKINIPLPIHKPPQKYKNVRLLLV